MDKPKQDKQLNLRIPPDLHKQARLEAVKEGRSLTQVIIELLIGWLRKKEQTEDK